MRILVIISILLLQLMLTGQTTKEVEIKFPKSKQVMEIYSVYKSDPQIKEGKYIRYYKSSKAHENKSIPRIEGTYKNGQKDGKWTYYNNPRSKVEGKISAVEYYKNGLKTGVWESHIYDKGDHIIIKHDFDKNIDLDTEIIISLKYPSVSKEQSIQGDVILRFRQNSDCTFSHFEIIESLDDDCDKEVIRRFTRLSELQKQYGNKMCEEKEVETKVQFRLM